MQARTHQANHTQFSPADIAREPLEQAILGYMEGHHTMSLATECGGLPHSASVFYVNIGYTLYFLTNPSSRHGENLSHNARASATINEDYSNWLDIKGLQLEGIVGCMGGILDHPQIAWSYTKKYPAVADFLLSPRKLGQAIAQKVAKVRFYKLQPSKISYLDNQQGFGHRDELVLTTEAPVSRKLSE